MSASTRGDISLVNKLLREAPHIINGMNHVRIVKLIVPTGADMCSQDGRTPLMAASEAGQVDMVCLLLERGAVIQLKNKVSCFLLSYMLSVSTHIAEFIIAHAISYIIFFCYICN